MTPGERVRVRNSVYGEHEATVVEAIGGVPAGEDHAGQWCVPVRFEDGSRHFVRLDDIEQP